VAKEFANLNHSNTLQNLPKLRFLVLKSTIWQPWSQSGKKQVSADPSPSRCATSVYIGGGRVEKKRYDQETVGCRSEQHTSAEKTVFFQL
jgi:hypothetical protein